MARIEKSRKRRIVKTKSSKGVNVVRKKRNPSAKKCAECGKQLHGIPRLITSKFRNLSKSKKRPERAYGGVLCSKCSRKKIIEKFR